LLLFNFDFTWIILNRYQKTKEEISSLNKIRIELERLDLSIDQDVLILREKIDSIDRDVAYLYQQVVKKEKEYSQAKAAYETKNNEKKMLTDHLNLIIFENEKRKDKKLEELMAAVGEQNIENGWNGFTEEEIKPK